eukprot:10649919-Ditylum_brightwellii.AAC.1
MASFVQGLHQWREGVDPLPPQKVSRVLEEAFHEQTHIEWDAALQGFLPLKWQRVQAEHFQKIGSMCTGARFISELIQKIFNVSWDFWHHHNHYLQLANRDDQ